MDEKMKEKIEKKLETYRNGEQQLRSNLSATIGAIQSLEELLEEIEGMEKDVQTDGPED